MSDNVSASEQDRNLRRAVIGPDGRPLPRFRIARGHRSTSPAAPDTPPQAARGDPNMVSPAGSTPAEELPAWKAKLKDAIKEEGDVNRDVQTWAEKMFVGDEAAMKAVLEHIKSISFNKKGKIAYKVSETEDVTNIEKGWKKILGELADGYAYSVYIKDRRIYFLQDRHAEEFQQVRAGTIAKGKDGARKVFAKLQTEDLKVMAEEFNKLPEDGRKITETQQQHQAMEALRQRLGWPS
eukprot:26984-Eustigmatos_ZCMA.PRE.1